MTENDFKDFEMSTQEQLDFLATKQQIGKLSSEGFFNERVRIKAVNEGLVVDKHGIVYDGRGIA